MESVDSEWTACCGWESFGSIKESGFFSTLCIKILVLDWFMTENVMKVVWTKNEITDLFYYVWEIAVCVICQSMKISLLDTNHVAQDYMFIVWIYFHATLKDTRGKSISGPFVWLYQDFWLDRFGKPICFSISFCVDLRQSCSHTEITEVHSLCNKTQTVKCDHFASPWTRSHVA